MGTVTLQFINIPDRPAPPPPPGTELRSDHIPGPPLAGASGGAVAERFDITGDTAVNSISGTVSYADINPQDRPSVSTQFSSFTYQNAQGVNVSATLTAEQLAAVKAIEVPLAVTQDPNGKNTGTATWTYTIADGAFDFLAAGETVTLTYLARVDNNYSPTNETTFVPFTIVITGTNDKPTLSATGGTITERVGTGNTAVDIVTGIRHLRRRRPDRPSRRQRGDLRDRSIPLLRCGGQRRHRDADAGPSGGDPRRRGAAERGAGRRKHPQRLGELDLQH